MKTIIYTKCPLCGAPIRIETDRQGTIRRQCPQCGAIIHVHLHIDIDAEKYDGAGFEKYLTAVKKMTPQGARRIAIAVENWLLHGKPPRYWGWIDLYQEYKEYRRKRHPAAPRLRPEKNRGHPVLQE